MKNDVVLFAKDQNGIATLTLNRPDIHNAFDDQVIQEFSKHLTTIESDPLIRVVVLRANGKSFCAGADLNWMQRMVNYSYEENAEDALAFANMLYQLNTLNKPVIGLIHGATFGGGLGLAACCDIVIASKNALFALTEVKIGLVPAVISPYVIYAIGIKAARRYFITGEQFTAEKAAVLGLVDEVVESSDLESKLNDFCQLLLQNSPHAIVESKNLIQSVTGQKQVLKETLQMTAGLIAKMRVSSEGQTGLRAFLEKTKPDWTSS